MLIDLIKPGHPVIFGPWPFVTDLRTGAFSGGGGEEAIMSAASAQITNYKLSELEGRQVIAVSNFPSKNIAGVISEVLVLGAISKEGVKLLSLDEKVENGTIVG